MNSNLEKSFSENPEEPLDELLRAAAWPEPNPGSLVRLQLQLKQCVQPRPRKRVEHWTMVLVALAASLLISVTIWAFQFRSPKDRPSTSIADTSERKPSLPETQRTANATKNPPQSQPADDHTLMTRSPTPYEAVLFRIALAKREAAIKAMRAQSPDQIVSLDEKPTLNLPDHASVVRAMLPKVGVPTLARLAAAEENADLQEDIFAELLTRGDEPSIGAYLDFVSQRNSAEKALSSLDYAKNPPVDVLFGFLRGVQASRRLAAALVLGRIDGPDTSQRLFQMVRGNVGRQEALVALLASSGNDASYYLNLAKRDISLAGILNGAQYQYRLLSLTQ
jgi:hypothetical protein